jgi:hypothetical protein
MMVQHLRAPHVQLGHTHHSLVQPNAFSVLKECTKVIQDQVHASFVIQEGFHQDLGQHFAMIVLLDELQHLQVLQIVIQQLLDVLQDIIQIQKEAIVLPALRGGSSLKLIMGPVIVAQLASFKDLLALHFVSTAVQVGSRSFWTQSSVYFVQSTRFNPSLDPQAALIVPKEQRLKM